MSIYSTPLQFGYFFALLFFLLFLVRGIREKRLSDKVLGMVMLFLALKIQDYTFGFSGINFLWEELDGFPRRFELAFIPTVYLYLKSQTNTDFKFGPKTVLHYAPFLIYFLFNVVIFMCGQSMVNWWQLTNAAAILSNVVDIGIWSSYIVYFILSLRLYRNYRQWIETRFSQTEVISLKWLRNFILLTVIGELLQFSWGLVDIVLDLPYEDDWWWQLFTVFMICYVGIQGYNQKQMVHLNFGSENEEETIIAPVQISQPSVDLDSWGRKVEALFQEEKVFLEPELSLSQLAKMLKTNTSTLSSVINQQFGKNFNDYVNEYRIREFEESIEKPENKHYTRLAIAYDCGFNSKATFNRALKKFGPSKGN